MGARVRARADRDGERRQQEAKKASRLLRFEWRRRDREGPAGVPGPCDNCEGVKGFVTRPGGGRSGSLRAVALNEAARPIYYLPVSLLRFVTVVQEMEGEFIQFITAPA